MKKVVVFIMVVVCVCLFGCAPKDYLYRKVNLGMSINEVKNNETAELRGSYDIGGSYTKKLYYVCYDDEFADGDKVTFEYFFTADDKLTKISVYYYGDKFTNAIFMRATKRKLDSKHGYISEEYSAMYSGYKWDCDDYKIYLVYWEAGYVLLEYYAK